MLLKVQSDNIHHKVKFSHTLVQTFKNHWLLNNTENADDDEVAVKGALLIVIIKTVTVEMYGLCALSVTTFWRM